MAGGVEEGRRAAEGRSRGRQVAPLRRQSGKVAFFIYSDTNLNWQKNTKRTINTENSFWYYLPVI
jgi:hypothetical protein